MPREYPLAFFEMSFLLPHFLREGRGKLAMYFTRVYNPVWTNPDGHVVDRDADRRGEGRAPRVPDADLERDRVVRRLRAADGPRLRAPRPHVQETHAARWIGFRQPVLRGGARAARARRFDLDVAGARGGRARPGVGGGRVLDRAVVAHRSRRRARHPQVLRVAVPARREAAHRGVLPAGSSSTACRACPRPRRRRGSRRSRTCASTAPSSSRTTSTATHEQAARRRRTSRAPPSIPATQVVTQGRRRDRRRGRRRRAPGFPTPSRKLEFFSKTLKDWKWPEHAVPGYIRSHVHWSQHRPRARARWCCCRPSGCRR